MATQKEIFIDLTENFLTVNKIAKKHDISTQAVYKTIKKLKKKGLISGTIMRGCKIYTHSPMGGCKEDKIRIHGGEFRIGLNQPTKHRKKVIIIKNTRIHIYKQSIQIWGSKSFYAENTEKALKKAIDFYHLLFKRIEDRLDIYFYKNDYLGIEQSKNFHVENVNCPLSHSAFKKDLNMIKIKDRIDEKLSFIFDKSKGIKNTESIHPEGSTKNASIIFDKVFNDYVHEDCFTPKQTTDAIGKLAHHTQVYVENIGKHLKVLDDINITMKKIQSSLDKFKKD